MKFFLHSLIFLCLFEGEIFSSSKHPIHSKLVFEQVSQDVGTLSLENAKRLLRNATLVKKVKNRRCYVSERSKIFIKIWDSNYSAIKYFERAVKERFYDGLAPLLSVIYDEAGVCRGYVMKKLSPPKEKLLSVKRGKFDVLARVNVQPQFYREILQKLIDRYRETGLVYIDIKSDSFMMDGNKAFLIDLDCVVSHEDYDTLPPIMKLIYDTFPPKEYRENAGFNN